MTTPSPTPNPLLALIRHAQRNLAYIRAQRGSYANPRYWADQQRSRAVDAAARTPERGRVNRAQTSLAARWAVADARRVDNPRLAERLDRDVQRHGVSSSELAATRWADYERGWQDARHRHEVRQPDPAQQSSMVSAGVPIAAGLIVSAALYDNAADWDLQSAEQLTAADGQWNDPVVEGNVAEVSEPVDSVAPADAGAEQDAGTEVATVEYQAAEVPEGFWAYSIDEQMAHVAEHGGSSITAGESSGVDMAAGAEIGTDAGAGMAT